MDVWDWKTTMHQWSSGRIHRCHRCDPGSIPGWCSKQIVDLGSWQLSPILTQYFTQHVEPNSNQTITQTLNMDILFFKFSRVTLFVLYWTVNFKFLRVNLFPRDTLFAFYWTVHFKFSRVTLLTLYWTVHIKFPRVNLFALYWTVHSKFSRVNFFALYWTVHFKLSKITLIALYWTLVML